MVIEDSSYSTRAEDIINAVQAVDDDLSKLALDELQDDNQEEEEVDEAETEGGKKQRSWLGRVGKGIYRRSVNLGKAAGLIGQETAEEVKELQAMIQSCRSPLAYKSGGVGSQDPSEVKACRSVLSMMLRQMGRTLLQGGNVMRVSFPIQCCLPSSILEIASQQAGYFHAFLPQAAAMTDPVERMKNVVACFVSSIILTSGRFLKPLNPILGETLQVEYSDGSKAYLEQTCHHPPITSFLLVGPGEVYKYSGFTEFGVGFGYNKMHLPSQGMREVSFKDGTRIEIGFPDNRINNLFWGDMHHEVLGSQLFVDARNCLRARLQFAPPGRKGLPSDYFEGVIERFDPAKPEEEGQVLSSIEGSWVGFCDFDKVRYWDFRSFSKSTPSSPPSLLPSDSRLRPDRNALLEKNIKLAQAEKLRLEEEQRQQRKLREQKKK